MFTNFWCFLVLFIGKFILNINNEHAQDYSCPGATFALDKMVTVLEIREESWNLNSYPKVKVLPFRRFNLMISVSTRMLYQEVREIPLRSGKSQGR